MGDRLAGGRVDHVAEALAVLLEIVAIVAGRGEAQTGDTDHVQHTAVARIRGFNADLPGFAIGIGARSIKIATDLDHIVGDAQRFDGLTHAVGAIAFADRGKVNLRIGLDLAQPCAFQLQRIAVTRPRLCVENRGLGRHRGFARCAKTPKLDQRASGGVKAALACDIDLFGGAHHVGQPVGHRHNVGPGLRIKARNFRGFVPVRHLGVDFGQGDIHRLAQFFLGHVARAVHSGDVECGAHGQARDLQNVCAGFAGRERNRESQRHQHGGAAGEQRRVGQGSTSLSRIHGRV